MDDLADAATSVIVLACFAGVLTPVMLVLWWAKNVDQKRRDEERDEWMKHQGGGFAT